MADAVVLALGHPARGDDGFGERLLRLFERRYGTPDGVLCLYGGTRPLAHYDRIAGCRWLVLLDAVRTDDDAIVVADPLPDLPSSRRLAVHQLGVGELLQLMATLGDAPVRVSLVGAPVASLDWGPPGPALERSLPAACDALARLLTGAGIRLAQGGAPACMS